MLKKRIKELAGPLFHWRASFAQEGEDLVASRLLEGQAEGFYIDVGCHHPFRYSNTYYFYRRGWRGVCIDPLPGTQRLFARWRPRDTVIEMGVSNSPSTLTYYMFNEPALNTFDASVAKARDGLRHYRILEEVKVKTDSLCSILGKIVLPDTNKIALLSVDVEGLDLQVLESNDWRHIRPQVVIAECAAANLASLSQDPVCNYLESLDYLVYAKTGNSIIFLRRESGAES